MHWIRYTKVSAMQTGDGLYGEIENPRSVYLLRGFLFARTGFRDGLCYFMIHISELISSVSAPN